MENIETRTYLAEDTELRSTGGRHVDGLAIVFNRKSELLGGNFREIILPEAINGVIEKSDVLCLVDHDKSRGVLARSTRGKGSLNLKPEQRGLRYSFDSPKTALGDELLEGLRRGDIRASSFGFTVSPGGDKWDKQADGSYIRTVSKIEMLYDVSCVYNPAYTDTTVAMRRLSEAGGTPVSISQEELLRRYDALKRAEPKRPETTIAQDIAAMEHTLAVDEAYRKSLEKPQGLVFINPIVKPVTRTAKPKKKGGNKGLFGI